MSYPTFEVPSGTINGINTVFTVSKEYIKNSTAIYLNGMLVNKNSLDGWVETSPQQGTITLNIPPEGGDDLQVFYLAAEPTSGLVNNNGPILYLKGILTNINILNAMIPKQYSLLGIINL